MRDVVDVVARLAAERWGSGAGGAPGRRLAAPPRRPVAVLAGRGPGRAGAASRVAAAPPPGVTPRACRSSTRKPDWLRPKVHLGPEVLELKRTVRDLGLVTVCEDAGCPNLSECWADGTATFMVLGERCTRACGFCLVDTRKPEAPARRRARAGRRGDRPHGPRPRRAHDGRPRRSRRRRHGPRRRLRRGDPRRRPGTRVETLISDARATRRRSTALRRPARRAQPQHGDRRPAAARRAAVGRLRPQPVRAGPGEGRRADDQVGPDRRHGRDRRRGRRPARRPRGDRRRHRHDRPVPAPDVAPPARSTAGSSRRGSPTWARVGEALGIGHVEASPLTRSSYHARSAAERATRSPSGLSRCRRAVRLGARHDGAVADWPR